MYLKRILDKEKNSSIKIIGLGDVGNKITVKLKENGCKYHTIAITPDMRDALDSPDTKLIVGLKTNKGLGSQANLELAQKCFEESLDELNSILRSDVNTNTYIIVGSLSSSSFTIGTIYLIDIINKLDNKKIYIISSDSTTYENDTRKQIKDKCINTINKYNPIIVEQTKQDESIMKYYDKLNSIMIDKINEIIN